MKILLLSDATMSANAGGLAQTLYNIFSFADPNDILCVTSDKSFNECPPTEPFAHRYLTYKFEIINSPRNRLAKYILPFANWFNYSYNNKCRSFTRIRQQIKSFDPEVIVSCPNGSVGLFMHHKLLSGLGLNLKRVFPYFMDDWMYQVRLTWLGGEIHEWVKKMLSDNRCWLMISSELRDILVERYGVSPYRVLEIHNPVDLSDTIEVEPVKKKEHYTLVYAGALWPMHFDAFLIMAKAVQQLKRYRKINLVAYTSINFWNWRKKNLEPLGVIYGGNIPYKDIHRKLNEADALVLVSSFSKDWYTHSKGSVQTKVTDYLKARRLIISCGPDYSANHTFLKRHKCGICIETDDLAAVANRLNEILNTVEDHNVEVGNGWALLENEFSFQKVHQKLRDFLSEPCQ